MRNSKTHWETYRKLAPFFGRIVSARLIQHSGEQISGVKRIHNLIEGIYKPANSYYALSIASMIKNPYADRTEYNYDRTWYFYYSPKAGPLSSAVNQSLFNCMDDGEPVLVIKQVSDKTHPKGARYKILGLGLIKEFDQESQLFRIDELTIDIFQQLIEPGMLLADNLIDTALQLEALEAWAPFVAENRAVYRISKEKRNAAFRRVVLENYANTCAITRSCFAFNKTVEAQAAHIISKEVNGTDDPRNGLAMSHTTHWAFDKGVFTISDQYEILVHPKAYKASQQNFALLDLSGQQLKLPEDESFLPHQEALLWHRTEVFGNFLKS